MNKMVLILCIWFSAVFGVDKYTRILDFISSHKVAANSAIDEIMSGKYSLANSLYGEFCASHEDICSKYGDDGSKPDPKREREIFNKICDKGKSVECKTLANSLKGFINNDFSQLPVILLQSGILLKKSCDLGFQEMCVVYNGFLLE